jgi:hypothetical protein
LRDSTSKDGDTPYETRIDNATGYEATAAHVKIGHAPNGAGGLPGPGPPADG